MKQQQPRSTGTPTTAYKGNASRKHPFNGTPPCCLRFKCLQLVRLHITCSSHRRALHDTYNRYRLSLSFFLVRTEQCNHFSVITHDPGYCSMPAFTNTKPCAAGASATCTSLAADRLSFQSRETPHQGRSTDCVAPTNSSLDELFCGSVDFPPRTYLPVSRRYFTCSI